MSNIFAVSTSIFKRSLMFAIVVQNSPIFMELSVISANSEILQKRSKSARLYFFMISQRKLFYLKIVFETLEKRSTKFKQNVTVTQNVRSQKKYVLTWS